MQWVHLLIALFCYFYNSKIPQLLHFYYAIIMREAKDAVKSESFHHGKLK